MADLRDYTKKNPVFVGTDGIRLPKGNNSQRTASSNVAGTLRFNTEIDGIETYTSAGWRPLAAPPSISTVSPSTFNGESGTEFIINGEGFTSDAQVYFVTANSTALLAASVSYYSQVQIRATTPRNILVQEEPLSVRVVQQSGTTTKLNCIDAGGLPTWVTTAGTLGSIFGANTVNVYVTATDPEGTAVSYQLNSGSLPNGLQLSANGLIQGLANSVLANTTYNFVIKANDTVNNNTDRSFSYTVLNRAPVINTAAGSLGTIVSGNAVPTATISAYDPDGGQLTYSISSGSLPANTGLGSANGVIQGTPVVVTTNTTYTFSVRTTDEGSLTASNTYTYTVLNRPPLWNTGSTLASSNVESFTPITINAYDPDGASITYTLTSGSVPNGLTFVSANATITGSVDDVDSNVTSTFTVTATDVGNDANARTFSLTVTPRIDPNFANTILLLKTSGNTIIKDASSNNLNLTVSGDARATNFSPYNTSWSNSFDGNGDNLATSSYVPITWLQNASPTGTIEAFVYLTGYRSTTNGYQQPAILGLGATYLNLGFTSSGNLRYYWWNGSSGAYITSSGTVPLNTWTHVAITFNAGNVKLWINGNDVGSGTVTALNNGSGMVGNLCIGSEEGLNSSSGSSFLGYISNLRIANNTVYSANFTPSATSLTITANTTLLSCHTNRFVNEANTSMPIVRNNDVKVVGWSPFPETDISNGSIYLDGSDNISITDANIPTIFTGSAWTIQAWVYLSSTGTTQGLINFQPHTTIAISLNRTGSGETYVYIGNGSTWTGQPAINSNSASNNLKLNSWNHLALVKNGSTITLWHNGTSAGSTTTLPSGFSSTYYIGSVYSGTPSEYFTGYISNFEIANTALYTSTFTPPGRLTATSNTKLLTFQDRQPHNNHGFQDKSNNKSLITRNGNTTQGTFSPFEDSWSYYNTGSSFVAFNSTNSRFAFGTNNFTFEFGLLLISQGAIFGTYQWQTGARGGWEVYVGNDGNTSIYPNSGSSASSGVGLVDRYRWTHVAIIRVGNVFNFYKNGVFFSSATVSISLDDPTGPHGNYLRIGAHVTDGGAIESPFTGYISNLRMSNTVRYSTTFTPGRFNTSDSNTVLLTAHTNRFYDLAYDQYPIDVRSTPSVEPFDMFPPNSVYSKTVNGGSIYFDGTTDYLTLADSDLWDLPGDFTIDGWIYTNAANAGGFVSVGRYDSPQNGIDIYISQASGNLIFYSNGAAIITGEYIRPKTWYHIALVRSGTTVTLYVNGKRTGPTATSSVSYTGVSGFGVGIGVEFGGGANIGAVTAAYIANPRIIKGQALYTANTSVPTEPPRVTPNTVLLIDGTDAAIIDYTGRNVIETVADAKSNNTTFKFSNSCIWLDGTTDSLYLPSSPIFAFATADFTLEAWVYLTAHSDRTILGYGSSNSGGVAIFADTSNQRRIYMGSTAVLQVAGAFPLNSWFHVAAVRSGSNLYLFQNGSQIGTTTDTTNITGTTFRVGESLFSNMVGGLSDVRVTRSARYTTNFTPPARSFPNR